MSLFMPLFVQMGFEHLCPNESEEEMAENILYRLSEEMDALLDDDDIREMARENMASVVEAILNSLGATNIRTQVKDIYNPSSPRYEVWFSFDTLYGSPVRHVDFITIAP